MFKIPRLFVMMFMQYFVQGAWNMTIGAVLATYNMTKSNFNFTHLKWLSYVATTYLYFRR